MDRRDFGSIPRFLGDLVVTQFISGHGRWDDLLIMLVVLGNFILLGILLVELLSGKVIFQVLEAVDESELFLLAPSDPLHV